jgi:hypothetical protein
MTKTTINLLDLELVFTQQKLLHTDDFKAACDRRGVSLITAGGGHLEALHRAGVLVPMYRIKKDIRAMRVAMRREELLSWSTLHGKASTYYEDLRIARDAGRLFDPRVETFVPWTRHRRKTEGTWIWTSEFVYSPYQLLLLPTLRRSIDRARLRHSASDRLAFVLQLMVLC